MRIILIISLFFVSCAPSSKPQKALYIGLSSELERARYQSLFNKSKQGDVDAIQYFYGYSFQVDGEGALNQGFNLLSIEGAIGIDNLNEISMTFDCEERKLSKELMVKAQEFNSAVNAYNRNNQP
jgi:hypothetical protein